MKPFLLIFLTLSFIPLAASASNNRLVPAVPAQTETLPILASRNILIADTRAIPAALVGRYVGSLRPLNSCGVPAPITIVVAKSGTVSSTTNNASGPNGVSARLSTSINPPLFTGEYISGSSQGFWQGQIVGTEIIGRAGVGSCRFIFFNLNKV